MTVSIVLLISEHGGLLMTTSKEPAYHKTLMLALFIAAMHI